MDWFRSGGWLLGAKITNAVTFLQRSRKSTDGCKWRQAAFEWKAPHFLFVGNHLDNKIEAGTFTLKNHTGNRVSESSGPALKKKLDVMVAWLTG